MNRVDAHHHVWDLSVRPQTWMSGDLFAPIARSFSMADFCAVASGAGIDASVVVQTVSDETETVELLALCEREPLLGAVIGWVDLRADDNGDRIDALRSQPGGGFLRGIRHQVHDEPDVAWICREDTMRGLAAVGSRGLVYELLLRPEHLVPATSVASRLDNLTFVVDHAAKPAIAHNGLEPWATDLRRLARLPNVVCKLSGLLTECDWRSWNVEQLRPYVEVVLDAFGPDRVMSGSDWPVCTLAASYGQSLAAHDNAMPMLSAPERHAVLAGTATSVYRLADRTVTPVGADAP